jgi:hypothetical protein
MVTTTAAMTPPTLGYARPGTFRAPRRHGRWRAWVAAALWIVPVACGTVVLARPALVAGLSIPVTLVLMFATPLACVIAMAGGFFLFPRGWRTTAVGLLAMILAILLPVVMWVRG